MTAKPTENTEVTDNNFLNNEIWKGSSAAIPLAKEEARLLKKQGYLLKMHSFMLSTYVSFFGSQSFFKKALWLAPICWHSVNLYLHKNSLYPMQINVLLSFLLAAKGSLWCPGILQNLNRLSVGKMLHSNDLLPHQEALIYITSALVFSRIDHYGNKKIEECIDLALAREERIRSEEDQLQGLRQLVRIFEKTGIVYEKIGLQEKSQEYFARAFSLATGEANTPLQAEKIKARMF